jgi:hypothetical protein
MVFALETEQNTYLLIFIIFFQFSHIFYIVEIHHVDLEFKFLFMKFGDVFLEYWVYSLKIEIRTGYRFEVETHEFAI